MLPTILKVTSIYASNFYLEHRKFIVFYRYFLFCASSKSSFSLLCNLKCQSESKRILWDQDKDVEELEHLEDLESLNLLNLLSPWAWAWA